MTPHVHWHVDSTVSRRPALSAAGVGVVAARELPGVRITAAEIARRLEQVLSETAGGATASGANQQSGGDIVWKSSKRPI